MFSEQMGGSYNPFAAEVIFPCYIEGLFAFSKKWRGPIKPVVAEVIFVCNTKDFCVLRKHGVDQLFLLFAGDIFACNKFLVFSENLAWINLIILLRRLLCSRFETPDNE